MNRDEHNDEVYIPSATALAFTALVLLVSFAVVVIACLEITQSTFWQKAPVILQRALAPHQR